MATYLYEWEDGSESLASPHALKEDAMQHKFRPGSLALTVAGKVVGITSWPWHEEPDEDKYRLTKIMVRLDSTDPSTNFPINYYHLQKYVGDFEL